MNSTNSEFYSKRHLPEPPISREPMLRSCSFHGRDLTATRPFASPHRNVGSFIITVGTRLSLFLKAQRSRVLSMSKRLALGFSFGLCGPAAAWVGYDFTTMSKLRGLTGWTAGDSAVRAYVVVVLTLQLAAPASLTARAMNHARRGWFLYAHFAPARFTHNTWHVSHRAPARTLPAVLSPTTHRHHSPTPHTSSPTHTHTHTHTDSHMHAHNAHNAHTFHPRSRHPLSRQVQRAGGLGSAPPPRLLPPTARRERRGAGA